MAEASFRLDLAPYLECLAELAEATERPMHEYAKRYRPLRYEDDRCRSARWLPLSSGAARGIKRVATVTPRYPTLMRLAS